MSATTVEKIRMRVFWIWLITLSVVISVFARRMLDTPSYPFEMVFENLQLIAALVLPQLSIMLAFYFGSRHEHLESISASQITVITVFSMLYHIIFIACLIFGIGFLGFETVTDGERLSRNTIAVVRIMGLFSLLMAPVAFLFSKPGTKGKVS